MYIIKQLFKSNLFEHEVYPYSNPLAKVLSCLYRRSWFKNYDEDHAYYINYFMKEKLHLYNLVTLVCKFIELSKNEYAENDISERITKLTEDRHNVYDPIIEQESDGKLAVGRLSSFEIEVIIWGAYIYSLKMSEIDSANASEWEFYSKRLLQIFLENSGIKLECNFLMLHKDEALSIFGANIDTSVKPSQSKVDAVQLEECHKEMASLKDAYDKVVEENALLKSRLSEYETPMEDIFTHQKVILEYLKKLMILSGCKWKGIHGNLKIAAHIAHWITGIKLNTCNTYFSNGNLSQTEHEHSIKVCNGFLNKLKSEIKL